jgi:hypothetical protein
MKKIKRFALLFIICHLSFSEALLRAGRGYQPATLNIEF